MRDANWRFSPSSCAVNSGLARERYRRTFGRRPAGRRSDRRGGPRRAWPHNRKRGPVEEEGADPVSTPDRGLTRPQHFAATIERLGPSRPLSRRASAEFVDDPHDISLSRCVAKSVAVSGDGGLDDDRAHAVAGNVLQHRAEARTLVDRVRSLDAVVALFGDPCRFQRARSASTTILFIPAVRTGSGESLRRPFAVTRDHCGASKISMIRRAWLMPRWAVWGWLATENAIR